MPKTFKTLLNAKMFENTNGKAKYGNSGWMPKVNGVDQDIVLKAGRKHSFQLFDNEDGSLGLNVSAVHEGEGGPDGELKPIGDIVSAPKPSKISLEDDIPF